ncbi:MAG: type I-C CRISPR-associated protein Cas8c/Csd1 [Paludibacteraceae bacterium]|nr:type I-C CRISPR-associated protein Cas8c/Csd1 [Paludibacteraceae bacterium]
MFAALAKYYENHCTMLPHCQNVLIDFYIELDREGNLITINDLRSKQNKRLLGRPTACYVRQGCKSNNIDADFLYGNAKYLLGYVEKPAKDTPEQKIQRDLSRAKLCLADFIQKIKCRSYLTADDSMQAVLTFLENDPLSKVTEKYPNTDESPDPIWKCLGKSNLTFHVDGDDLPICSRFLNQRVAEDDAQTDKDVGICSFSGKIAPIARKFDAILLPGNGTQPGPLSSFNKPSFCHYGRTQGENASISEEMSLNGMYGLKLLWKSKINSFHLKDSDVTHFFWTESGNTEIESLLTSTFFADKTDEDSEEQNAIKEANERDTIQKIRSVYMSLLNGEHPEIADMQVYCLAIKGSPSRNAVVDWYAGDLATLAENIVQYFTDLEIGVYDKPQSKSIYSVLASTKKEFKDPVVPPHLGEQILDAALHGTPFPESLFVGCLTRIKAGSALTKDRRKEPALTAARAGVLKGYLNRQKRIYQQKELTMSLDENNNNVAYLLGRLFFLLETSQYRATRGNGFTSMMSMAAAQPSTVFPGMLEKYNSVYRAKLNGAYVNDITELVGRINSFPVFQNNDQQGEFFIGYYHERLSRKLDITKENDNND